MSSNSKKRWNCLVSAFFGSVRIVIRSSRLSWWIAAITGRRPMNSGISPYSIRSSGSTCSNISPRSFLLARESIAAPKPTPLLPIRLLDHLVEVANEPPQMNRMFVVSIVRNSWCGCLRPPCGGTEAVVPSRIFRSACCTPSPETSRVIDGLSALRAILSISSM